MRGHKYVKDKVLLWRTLTPDSATLMPRREKNDSDEFTNNYQLTRGGALSSLHALPCNKTKAH
jgi:hypothetical protein